jgi:hypothetical protein
MEKIILEANFIDLRAEMKCHENMETFFNIVLNTSNSQKEDFNVHLIVYLKRYKSITNYVKNVLSIFISLFETIHFGLHFIKK